jgi:hypothetical protein
MRAPFLALLPLILVAQDAPPSKAKEAADFHAAVPTPDPAARVGAFLARRSLADDGRLAAIPWRNIGPMGQGGRVVALAVDARKPEVWIAAFATGGLWITRTEGATWEPLFDGEQAFAIGDVTVVWGEPGVPRTIWVGTGEANASRSSYAGAGLFRSDDGGKSWRPAGLANAHRIARIVVHPDNPDRVFVAAQGPLYTEGGERGVFATADGGRTWSHALKAGPRTGAADLLLDWQNPDVLYAALWEKDRKPWNFLESGPGSGIHKSTDGGRTWTRLGGGFPDGEGVGRIGLAQSRQDPKRLYAFLDNQTPRPASEKDPFEDPEKLTFKAFAAMSAEAAAKLDPKALKTFLKDNGFHPSHTAEKVLADLKSGALTPRDIAAYAGDVDTNLARTDAIAAEVYATSDGGATWARTHAGRLDSVYNSYGYYFGQIRVDPADDRTIYLLGFPALKSTDGGRTFKGVNGENWDSVHPDHHALWIDPKEGRRLVLGNDGGLNVSLDGGEHWRPVKNLPVGQFYTIAVDQAEPFRVYGGLQDNGVRRGPATPLKPNQAADSWTTLYGGDGGFVAVNPKDNATVYLESQFGVMARHENGKTKGIRPAHKLKEPAYRFNWMTPIVLSPHSPDILYTASQKVLRSLDRGDTWTEISGDLSSGKKPRVAGGGDVPFGTVTALAESPLRFGLLYAGTDDGRLWASRDGGFQWTEATKGLPAGRWVSRVEPSRHAEGTVYATFNAYRDDASLALVFKSADHGATWTSIASNLPGENVNVIREDAKNPDLLYLGTDFGAFATVDGGKRWDILGPSGREGLPHVPVHDLALHAASGTLVAGTHGRSAWTAPVAALSAWTAEVRAKDLHLFEVKPVKAERWWKQDRPGWWPQREAEAVAFWFHARAAGPAALRLEDEKGQKLREWKLDARPGLNRADWDLLVDRATRKDLPEGRRAFVQPGKHKLVLALAGAEASTPIVVEPPKDPE